MTLQALDQPRFVRRTALRPGEYNTHFRMLDEDLLQILTSPEADEVTPLMSKIYLRLLKAPHDCRKGERELHFAGEIREGKRIKAWDQLCQHLRVSSETARKALLWMHEQGVIGYTAFKNQVGIFIFLNRAVSSIKVRPTSGGKKIFDISPASPSVRPASPGAAASNDPYGFREDLEFDLNRRAPQNGAETRRVDETSPESVNTFPQKSPLITQQKGTVSRFIQPDAASGGPSIDEIVRRLKRELEPTLHTAAAQAARLEHERTRDWLDKHGIPKATRVAHKEAYNVLRSHGVINTSAERTRSGLEVGPRHETPKAVLLSPEEIKELAEVCMAMLETHGQAIDVTLSQVSIEAGGYLLAEDAPRVRELALLMAGANR